jgi:hypothetical protein
MRVVYQAGHLIDAHLVRHALEQAGFRVFVLGEALLGGLGELPVYGAVSVSVADKDWAQARAIVETLPIVVGDSKVGVKKLAATAAPGFGQTSAA